MMVIENKIHIISRNVLRITIPPFDLRIPQIIHVNNTIALFRVDCNRLGKGDFEAVGKIKINPKPATKI